VKDIKFGFVMEHRSLPFGEGEGGRGLEVWICNGAPFPSLWGGRKRERS